MEAQVVVITGCSKGIGEGIALLLAKDPERRFRVYATMRNSAIRQDDIKSKAGSTFGDTLFVLELDVTKQETVDSTVKEIVKKEGQIDVLVNNAGINKVCWWQDTPIDVFQEVMDVNYFGCVRMTKAVVPYMKERRTGKILQISSVLGFKAVPSVEPYISSKFALEGFSEAIAPQLRKFNVWVSIVQPGFVSTPLTQQISDDVTKIYEEYVVASNTKGEDKQIIQKMLTADADVVLGTEFQTVNDIATLIKDVILSPKPDFRYQTSQTAKKMARQRFVDPTGNDAIDVWLQL